MNKKTFKDLKTAENVYEVNLDTMQITKHTVDQCYKCYGGGGALDVNGQHYCIDSVNQTRFAEKFFLQEEEAKTFIEWYKTAKTFGKLVVGDTLYCVKEDNTIAEEIISSITFQDEFHRFYNNEGKLIFRTVYGLSYDKILKKFDETCSIMEYRRIFINKADAEKDVTVRAKRQIKSSIERKNKIKPNGTILTKKDRFGNDLHVGDKVHYIYSYPAPGAQDTMLYTINEGIVTDETDKYISVKCTAPTSSDTSAPTNRTTSERIVVIKKWNKK